MIYLYFSFGITFAAFASIQGSLYNPVDFLSVNGLLYMFGGTVYCIQLAIVIILTLREKRSCYFRSFIKATVLSVAHISPIYICSLAISIDLSIVVFEFFKYKKGIHFPRVWLLKNILVNFSLLLLYFYN
jgi:hypothetical protein